jgi:PAS domain S-box-containing protein
MSSAMEASILWGSQHSINPWISPELLKLARAAVPESEAAKLRRERRYLVNQPAQLVAVVKHGGVWPVRIRDISPRGMQLMTEEAILAPPEVRVRWNGRDVPGVIRYNHKYDVGSYRIGIELDSRSGDLMREILARQSEELRDANLLLEHQAGLARRYAVLLDLVSDAVAVLAPDGVVLFWNRPAEQLYGWTAAEIVGRNFEQLIRSEPPLRPTEMHANTPERRLRQFCKDGSAREVLSRCQVEKDSAGRPQAVLCISREMPAPPPSGA